MTDVPTRRGPYHALHGSAKGSGSVLPQPTATKLKSFKQRTSSAPSHPKPNLVANFFTYFGFAVLFLLGWFRDIMNHIFKRNLLAPKGFAPLVSDFDDFFNRRMYSRVQDAWNRPISSAPGAYIDVMERVSNDENRSFTFTGKTQRCLNLGSYNYLGFGDPNSPCKAEVLESLEKYSIATTSTRMSVGTTPLHVELEELVASFVGKPEAMVFGMGFATNGVGVPALIGKGGLIISDSLNHASIVCGARSSGAMVKVFKHNDVDHLEKTIRRAIIDGQPKTHRPWTKILIMTEGIYSMEGETCPLADIVAIKKKYKCYLYVDEAHSIGAMGKTGRGICEHTGVSPNDVDILMGTFTKSFGAVGGYIAASHEIIDSMRQSSAGSVYSASITPACCAQVISSMRIIAGLDGTDLGQRKIKQLHDNANYFRKRVIDMGCHVLGEENSPVVPIMLYHVPKVIAFSRECLKEGLAVVVVGFPATPLLGSRARICISAAHSMEDIEKACQALEKIVARIRIRFAHNTFG